MRPVFIFSITLHVFRFISCQPVSAVVCFGFCFTERLDGNNNSYYQTCILSWPIGLWQSGSNNDKAFEHVSTWIHAGPSGVGTRQKHGVLLVHMLSAEWRRAAVRTAHHPQWPARLFLRGPTLGIPTPTLHPSLTLSHWLWVTMQPPSHTVWGDKGFWCMRVL